MSSGLAGSGNLVSPGDQQRVDLRSLLSAVMTKEPGDQVIEARILAGQFFGRKQIRMTRRNDTQPGLICGHGDLECSVG
jgi:hypothetical protein